VSHARPDADRNVRLCECDCGRSLEGMRSNARYASRACRTRDWKRRRGITGIRYVKASQNAKSRPSGRQLTQRKARTAVARGIRLALTERGKLPPGQRLAPEQIASIAVFMELPALQQRALLAEREQREEATK